MYKTILVHVDETARSVQRIEVAASLARRYDAHLVGTAMTGLSAYVLIENSLEVGMPPITFPVKELRVGANRALDVFDRTAARLSVNSFERRVVDDEAGLGMCLQAPYSDLVVISQTAPDEFQPRLRSDFPEYVLLNCSRPVLVLPLTGVDGEFGRRVTVAWNGSAEAVRAITSAIPLLQRAEKVELIVFDADGGKNLHGEEPGADMALYLARHGIIVEVTATRSEAGHEEGDALMSFAVDHGADLIVMGAYGHSRFHELLLGGMSRTALGSSPVPLWMSH
jgi:nucleotide-binding universal stress UspA family protein